MIGVSFALKQRPFKLGFDAKSPERNGVRRAAIASLCKDVKGAFNMPA